MSRWTPSIVPSGMDQNIYLVVDGFQRGERLFRETPLDHTDLESVIKDMMDGQYNDPLRVVSFNPEEHWAQDVSEDVAREIQKRADRAGNDLSSTIEDFVARHLGPRDQQLCLRSVSGVAS